MLDLKGYGPALMDGAIVTIELAFLSLALSVALGLVGASAKLSQSRVAKGIATTYTTLIRGVPDLVMMLLFYYGGQVAVNMLSDYIWEAYEIDFFFQFDPFISGVVTIGLIFGAYMTETFRGAFLAVETGQIEAARAYGFTRFHTFRRIMLPQMLRHALPGLGNNWQVLLKTTALVSIIGLTDMVRVAEEAAKAERMPFHFFIPVAFVYLALTAGSELFIKWLDKRANVGVVQGS
ncbi:MULTISPECIES: ABC transporter permease [Marinobacter]|jgi:arginine/ornithine transport system permease protein|uniref:ABC transporter permease n=1 Tax=Marinobacter TaxID=2742 RepID=UPI0007D90E06|nr:MULTISPECIES: ABC transporter permease [Marinobacter]MBL3826997.1 ABC transporter permease [Marinobacter sp. MC3]MBL3895468.1 ABC transporter permease [Marinobacter sp. MW3]MCD1649087.1 ABC transporter permease [Marinobacter adhaerens]OAN89029.1 ABC transporter [Marinobacter sp. EhN04]OAN92012.1 ABC transporter [Marinobacter sp. EhC06]